MKKESRHKIICVAMLFKNKACLKLSSPSLCEVVTLTETTLTEWLTCLRGCLSSGNSGNAVVVVVGLTVVVVGMIEAGVTMVSMAPFSMM